MDRCDRSTVNLMHRLSQPIKPTTSQTALGSSPPTPLCPRQRRTLTAEFPVNNNDDDDNPTTQPPNHPNHQTT